MIIHKSTILALILATFFPSVAAAEFLFAIVPNATNNPFSARVHDGCLKAQEELEDVTCLFVGPQAYSERAQINVLDELIDQGIDGIAVAPSHAKFVSYMSETAAEAGIPVITWKSDLLKGDQIFRQTYIGSDNYRIGVELALLIQARHPGGGTICMQTGGISARNHSERLKGARDTLAGIDMGIAPGWELSGEGGWQEHFDCPLVSN